MPTRVPRSIVAIPISLLLALAVGCESARPATEPAGAGAESAGGGKSGPTEQELASVKEALHRLFRSVPVPPFDPPAAPVS